MMALLHWDGFEGLSASADGVTASSELARRGYTVLNNAAFCTNGVAGAPPLHEGAQQVLWMNGGDTGAASGRIEVVCPFDATPTVIVQFRYWSKLSRTTPVILAIGDGTVEHVTLTVNKGAGNTIVARRGSASGTILGESSAGAIVANEWARYAVKVTIDDTNGGVLVQRNGVDVLKLGAFADTPAALDTRNGGAAVAAALRLHNNGSTVTPAPTNFTHTQCAFDDLIVMDTTGAEYNDILPEYRIGEVLVDDTVSAQFAPSTGTNHGAADDADGPDNDATYNASTTSGHKDILGLASPAGVVGVARARVVVVARKEGIGDQSLHVGTKFGTTEDVSAAQPLTDTYAEYRHEFDVNPDTLAALTAAAIGDAAIVYSIPA